MYEPEATCTITVPGCISIDVQRTIDDDTM
jgi:hypothetical protein